MSAISIAILPPERLGVIEPLWVALHEHHMRGRSRPGALREQVREVAWRRRRSIYERYLTEPRCFCLLAERRGDPVGYAMVWVGSGPQVGAAVDQVAYLTSLSVLPGERGRGIGAALLHAVEERGTQRRSRALMLGVHTWNEEAIRFYERHGLRRVRPGVYAKRLTTTAATTVAAGAVTASAALASV
jgi:ribosomal protein S18 acetylase RimI-like enzyme